MDEPVVSVPQVEGSEIEKEADGSTGQIEVRPSLRVVDRMQFRRDLDLDDDGVLNEEIGPKGNGKMFAAERERDRLLAFHAKSIIR